MIGDLRRNLEAREWWAGALAAIHMRNRRTLIILTSVLLGTQKKTSFRELSGYGPRAQVVYVSMGFRGHLIKIKVPKNQLKNFSECPTNPFSGSV